MAIIETQNPDLPLDQGDLLRGVKLFFTDKLDGLDGGQHVQSNAEFCLVLSRPCVTSHKGAIVVAAVQKFPSQTPATIDDWDEALDFLTHLRDADDSPDVFYLGQLPGMATAGRYAARLDRIHTIEVPLKPDVRTAFIRKHRVAKVHVDFRRDLHTRLFRSFASLGFDDISWFSDADLSYLVEVGRAELKILEAARSRLEAGNLADGGKANELRSIANRSETLLRKMAPYPSELERRNALVPT